MTDMPDAGWLLDEDARRELIARVPPRYTHVIAHHVTAKPTPPGGGLPPPVRCDVVGRGDDGLGVEALVVEIDGVSARPDGSIYHITWSLEPGRKARESNDVLRDHGWERWDEPIPVPVTPARFDWRDPA